MQSYIKKCSHLKNMFWFILDAIKNDKDIYLTDISDFLVETEEVFDELSAIINTCCHSELDSESSTMNSCMGREGGRS